MWCVISLFCGCGGLDLGMYLALLDALHIKVSTLQEFCSISMPLTTILAVDSNKAATTTFVNNGLLHGTLLQTNIRTISHYPECDMVIGGFPCPGFSTGGPRRIEDPINTLYLQFVECIRLSKPKIFVAENVAGILSINNGATYTTILETFSKLGYVVYSQLLNAVDYQVPQHRERVFFVGIRIDIPFVYKFPTPIQHRVTLRDAIADLVATTPIYYQDSYSSRYLSRNRKKSWDDYSFTIPASPRQCPLHPMGLPMIKLSQDSWSMIGFSNRRLSIQEIARIQTFPDWFRFDTTNIPATYKQIGNAVPPLLSKHIFLPIIAYILAN